MANEWNASVLRKQRFKEIKQTQREKERDDKKLLKQPQGRWCHQRDVIGVTSSVWHHLCAGEQFNSTSGDLPVKMKESAHGDTLVVFSLCFSLSSTFPMFKGAKSRQHLSIKFFFILKLSEGETRGTILQPIRFRFKIWLPSLTR